MRYLKLNLLLISLLAGLACGSAFAQTPPVNFKVAFIGDQGLGSNARGVLQLIEDEGASMVLHQGDFDYYDDPDGWDQQITDVLGANFPYFASPGNHDTSKWGSTNGYKQKLIDRLARIPGASCSGDYGEKSACTYQGLFFILSSVGTIPNASDSSDPDSPDPGSHSEYIAEALAQSDAIWKICTWHKNQRQMQVGGKSSEVGWAPYEVCRKAGAMIATGHEHSYHRTKTLIDTENQTVDPNWPDPNNVRLAPETTEPGATFVHVSGIAGRSLRNQDRCLPTTYPYGCNGEWANIYTSDQGAQHGALFCTFNVDGQPDKAACYFKDIDGATIDQFEVTSFLGIAEDATPSAPSQLDVI